VSTAQVKGGNR